MERNYIISTLLFLCMFSNTTLQAKDSKFKIIEKKDLSKFEKDSCNVLNNKIDDINLLDLTDKTFLSYILSFSLKEKKSSPKSIFVLMTVENCKNEKLTIKTELKYNEKNNIWSAKEGMIQKNDCTWRLSSYKILALNECDDEYLTKEIEVPLFRTSDGVFGKKRTIAGEKS
ncbi:hypothetical protein IU405_03385 [Polaribacter sp. BAL334]|uniref:hypothetical protein n=1 Tax=Polaribacter sp. BAL334 TaxID=1708178 RepID=UPI0018D27012|nr:hypothetical protein [Polaribacter sp. BAL334]MBG7611283.1 hypothetical protein [Polaribacter sp. BAL334]